MKKFNRTTEFSDIKQKLDDIVKECNIRGIPIFWCAVVKEDSDTKYEMNGITPASLGIQIKNDKIPDLIMLMRS